ncbi:MAG: dihydropteroate synthase [Gammaproteobacteria bacterium]|jgi:dihydropteroate synthase
MTSVPAAVPHPKIMGILNVTPDSFSDGGKYIDRHTAIERGLRMVDEGASIIDVGGESSRPGSNSVPARIQIERVVPVIENLKITLGDRVELSVDSSDPEVAARALAAGATIINDISAGQHSEMLDLAAEKGASIVLMHMQGSPATMQQRPHYDDVVKEICDFLADRIQRAYSAGVSAARVIIDPGIGFGKSTEHNLHILRELRQIVELGRPVLLGTSRKRFLSSICQETTFERLVGGTCATSVLGALAGASIFRVHDVRENRQAIDVVLATLNGRISSHDVRRI